ncbi:MAG: ROK family protein [Candidatus Limnocylindrales bacterium]
MNALPGAGGGVDRGRPVLALDLGASRLRAALVGPDGSILSRAEVPSATERGPAAVLEDVVALLAEVRALGSRAAPSRSPGVPTPAAPGGAASTTPRISPASPIGIGISAIGPVDFRAGIIVDPPNADRSFRDVPVVAELERRLGLPAFLDRDTNVALLGELAFGAARGVDDVVYLTVSTGIGGAVLAAGVLLHGPDGTAGELGHLLVELDGPPCGCGARGHLEAIASGSGIARAAREAVRAGASPMLAEVAERVGPHRLSAADVSAAEDAGDRTAAEIMGHARRAFAAAMVTIADVFDPTLVVVGGSIALAQGDRWLGPARAAVRETAFRAPARRARIVPAALGDDVSLVGCLPLVWRRMAGAD